MRGFVLDFGEVYNLGTNIVDPSRFKGRMEDQFVQATEKAISQLVVTFQGNPKRFWNERDLHWILFYLLNRQEIFRNKYGPDVIRAEFPTRVVYKGMRPARGHYDLVILQPESLTSPLVSKMEPWAPWDKFLSLVQVLVAVELKMWLDRWSDTRRVDWDIEKLTDTQNGVKHAYLLNFVQIDFRRPQMREYYRNLWAHLVYQRKQHPDLKILCVPSEAKIQLRAGENWVSPL